MREIDRQRKLKRDKERYQKMLEAVERTGKGNLSGIIKLGHALGVSQISSQLKINDAQGKWLKRVMQKNPTAKNSGKVLRTYTIPTGESMTRFIGKLINGYRVGERIEVWFRDKRYVWEKTSARGWSKVRENPKAARGAVVNPKRQNLYYVTGISKSGKPKPKKNHGVADFKSFQKQRLNDLSQMFQGHANGDNIRVAQSDLAPKVNKYRLGYLVQMKVKNGSTVTKINFDGEAYLSGDLRNNLWAVGKDAVISNLRKPNPGKLTHLGKLIQIDYITAKKHIEGGKTVRFWHPLGEVDKEYPDLFIDADGFPIIVGGGYDVWDVGIVN